MNRIRKLLGGMYISETTQRFLRFGMLLITGLSLTVLDCYLEASRSGALGGSYLYPLYIEAILVSVGIGIAGAVLIEHTIRQRE